MTEECTAKSLVLLSYSPPKCVHLRAKALNMESLVYPPRLREGDRVIILSPSSKIDKAFLRGAARRLKSARMRVLSPSG